MLDNSLPDEIVSEILSPALKVADDVFSDDIGASPFVNYSESTSAYLLVCKSWLRVATPLLYNVVVLRSKAQAKALATALSKNKQLGQFIKKLRVEGGYGSHMLTILQCTPHISDVFLSFEIYSTDSTHGLCKGLPLINPTRLILRDRSYKPPRNKMVESLFNTVVESIPKWDRLTVFDSPYTYHGNRIRALAAALVLANRLHTLVVLSSDCLRELYPFFEGSGLKLIQIKISSVNTTNLPTEIPIEYMDRFTPVHRNEANTYDIPPVAPSLNPLFTPMSSTSQQVQDTIWSRILYFAMSCPERQEDPLRYDLPPNLWLLLVSKTFLHLGLPHYYSHVAIRDSQDASHMAAILSRHPSLGPHIRTICPIIVDFGLCDSFFDDSDADTHSGERSTDLHAMLTIFSTASGLIRVTSRLRSQNVFGLTSQTPIPWDAFVAMAESSGGSLRECAVKVAGHPLASPAVFGNFAELRQLVWACSTSFACDEESVPADALSKLHELEIMAADDSLFTVLSYMKLPSLQHLTLPRDVDGNQLLHAHGSRLQQLQLRASSLENLSSCVFDLCPNLTSFVLTWDYSLGELPPNEADFMSKKPALSLNTIKFDLSTILRDKKALSQWEDFFDKFPPKSLPNLCELQLNAFEWPKNEREISKSHWVRIAEKLLVKNIGILDRKGNKWRQRLK